MDNDDDKNVYDYGIKKFIRGKFILTKNPDDMRYQIFVKPPGHTILVECYSFDTIDMLKKKIQEKGGIPHQRQKLRFYCGFYINDLGKTLKDYRIGKESTLECSYSKIDLQVSELIERLETSNLQQTSL